MKIAIFGTGMVAQHLAGKLHEIGHEVTLGTRDPEATKARTEAGPFGQPSFSEWYSGHAEIALATFAEAAEGAEIAINAGSGQASLKILAQVGAERLEGKILIDVG